MKKLLLLAMLLISPTAFAVDCVVSQYDKIPKDGEGREPQVAVEPGVTAPIVVSFTGTSVPSATFSNRTVYIGIICTAKAHFEIGASPVAVAAENPWLVADQWYFFGLRSTGLKIAFIQGS